MKAEFVGIRKGSGSGVVAGSDQKHHIIYSIGRQLHKLPLPDWMNHRSAVNTITDILERSVGKSNMVRYISRLWRLWIKSQYQDISNEPKTARNLNDNQKIDVDVNSVGIVEKNGIILAVKGGKIYLVYRHGGKRYYTNTLFRAEKEEVQKILANPTTDFEITISEFYNFAKKLYISGNYSLSDFREKIMEKLEKMPIFI